MTKYIHEPRGLAVPNSRAGRMARLGGMAAGVAGNMAFEGGRQLLSGQRPRMEDLLLTPGNAARITAQLAQMRGAAMKVGQLLSLEGGDFLPPELAEILGHLRADAHFMPPKQLDSVLKRHFGPGYRGRFAKFDVRPVAAASIGQVHRAVTKDGRDVALKVQYPGVRESIDSDVRNVGSLLRLSGLVPKEIDLAPLMEEARRQLHEEADYGREAEMLSRFGGLLAGDDRFVVPELYADLTTRDVLGMSFVESVAIEGQGDAPQKMRDRLMESLISLMLRELFEFGLMQTDPNFANYRVQPETGRLVLLDFGATRVFGPDLVGQYRGLMRAGFAGDRGAVNAAMEEIGFLEPETEARHREPILDMVEMAMAPLRAAAPFDFAGTGLARDLRRAGEEFAEGRDFWVIPPMDALYLQRKMGGMFLLGARLRAHVALRPLLEPYL
ncbi:ABC-1 domain protein (plasmid) [Dinoroseobacter shibae DFL 12 = DSM 16493]|jgi:predicted unusual protein kinase regulating ubiquinone biosynthesis (AarF/ABC1/UbiB family)|uniref:ABC-1 domain protein n=1 Tax=Dinoroseobacter shibae (strain DSM 16493 / NCIMB 14021 / DFL 12) TaxID=398580 RepID=A8LUK9_DINSH|nr:AarF/ABC1/UbiB kinase family protein [Dinoroseobacter shibae]ABV95926.1 ABC-1 domain protein [Dinoroseobacter shibae DFL 12 = DSM 16493]URF49168.1 AarF/ABC1/UbiB kinase family protein [Dinoroseobacter shibae]URF53476.1 AarF/ABC1/UbiB kinase family protein [Dinoroseobacter shibae]